MVLGLILIGVVGLAVIGLATWGALRLLNHGMIFEGDGERMSRAARRRRRY